MKTFCYAVSMLLAGVTSAYATVAVSNPANGATVGSSVNYIATATTTTCSNGVAAMGIYVNNVLAYSVNGSSLNTNIVLNSGTYYTVVQEWDNCGGATSTAVTITVPGGSTQNGVVVSAPANNSTVTSPVTYAATAGSTTCSTGIAAMGIYVNNSLAYSVNGAALNTNITLKPGSYDTVVQEWDNCGGSKFTPVIITIPGGGTQNGVVVSSPANNSTVTSPVTYTATAGTTTCAGGVAAMGIYVNSSLAYSVNGANLNTQLNLNAGNQHTVVEEWDNCGGALATPINITIPATTPPTVSFTATSSSIANGNSSTLTVTATNATQVTVTGTDGSSYNLQPAGGTQSVSPAATTTYTAHATGVGGQATATATVTVTAAASLQSIDHVIFMLQENHTFDNYFGMLNPYRQTNGWNVGDDGNTYNVDGIDDKLTTISNQDDEGTSFPLFKFTSTCIDDESSDWLASYGDVKPTIFLLPRADPDGWIRPQR